MNLQNFIFKILIKDILNILIVRYIVIRKYLFYIIKETIKLLYSKLK